jgi:hypothetical protein
MFYLAPSKECLDCSSEQAWKRHPQCDLIGLNKAKLLAHFGRCLTISKKTSQNAKNVEKINENVELNCLLTAPPLHVQVMFG